MEPWELLAAVATRQHMLVTTWQAEAAGIHRSLLAARVRGHGWSRYTWGVTGLPGPKTEERRLAAAVLAYARPTRAALRVLAEKESDQSEVDAMVSAALEAGQLVAGRSAAWLHGIAGPPETHALWLPSESGRVSRDGFDLRYGGCPAGERTWVLNLPTVDVVGSIIETARMARGTFAEREDELIWQMSRADGMRKATLDMVEERAMEIGRFWGCDVLRSAIGKARGTLSHSRTEQRSRLLVAQALAPLGLHAEPRPYEIWVEGHLLAEADIAVLPITLDVEVDGPHHRFPAQQRKDARRDRSLRRVGWTVERFPVEVVDERPKTFVAQVRAAAETQLARVAG